MDGLKRIHAEVLGLDGRCRDEQIQVQCKFDQLKKKHFDHRADLLKKIPNFWKEVLLNFGNFRDHELVHEKEVELLDYIDDIRMEDNLDARGSHRFTFTFKENPFFHETELVKDIKVGAMEEDSETTCTPITFKKNPVEREDVDAGDSFL